MRYEFTNCMCIAELLLRKVVRTGGAISMSLAREWTGLQMRMVTGGKLARGTVFGNLRAEAGLDGGCGGFRDAGERAGRMPPRQTARRRRYNIASATKCRRYGLTP